MSPFDLTKPAANRFTVESEGLGIAKLTSTRRTTKGAVAFWAREACCW